MINSFKCKYTKTLSNGQRVKQFVNIENVARRKLRQLEIANHIETLKGDRSGQYSIRINNQWRICFYWSNAGADDVEIVDYH